jgi:hypothetical protein
MRNAFGARRLSPAAALSIPVSGDEAEFALEHVEDLVLVAVDVERGESPCGTRCSSTDSPSAPSVGGMRTMTCVFRNQRCSRRSSVVGMWPRP